MNKVLLPALCLLTLYSTHATAQKIVVNAGQKLSTVTAMHMEMNIESLGQSVKMENVIYAEAEAASVSDTGFIFKNKITRVTMNSMAMGQAIKFDSDKPEDRNGPKGPAIKQMLDSVHTIGLNKQGKISFLSGTANFGDGSLTGFINQLAKGQSYPLFIALPANPVNDGDSWSDSTSTNDSVKMVYTYTLVSTNGVHRAVNVNGIVKMITGISTQGMDIDIDLDGTIKGNAVYDKSTGIVETNNTVMDLKGAMGMMGQSVPVTMKVNTVLDVNKK